MRRIRSKLLLLAAAAAVCAIAPSANASHHEAGANGNGTMIYAGASDPTYLVYTLGKLQIMKLREDYAKLKGDSFSLKEFHDTLMLQGGVPLKIIRQAMLGNNGPTL